MKSAHNYNDFTVRLVERVCTEKSSDDLVLLAAIHSQNLSDSKTYDLLKENHYRTLLVRPYLLTAEAHVDEQPSKYETAKLAIDLVLETKPEDWVRFQMYNLGVRIGRELGRIDSYTSQSLDKMEQLLEVNRTLSCLKPMHARNQAWQYARIDYVKAARIMEYAYNQALEIDNLLLAAAALNTTALFMRNFDRTRALQLVSEAERINGQLDIHWLKVNSMRVRRGIHSARGEFSAALDCVQELIRLAEEIGAQSMGSIPHSMAIFLNEIGENEEALEWGRMAMDTLRGLPWAAPYPYFDVARALIGLGRLDEARKYLDNAKKRVLKTGDELYLQVEYFNDGLLEMADGRLLEAMKSFERALDICERIGIQNRLNSTIIAMTECEIEQFRLTEDNQLDEYSGQWMKRLEKEVAEKDIPGIQGRLLLLKAKLRLKQRSRDEAETLFSDIRRLAENPYVRYLADRVSILQAQARLQES
jgi:tetratricopeptide (TPR) repeat protein